MPLVTVLIYNENFSQRYSTAEWLAYSVSEFDGLEVEQAQFPSNKGQQLMGYHYSKPNQAAKGVLVLSHGLGGGGHNSYMHLVDYFASHGYLVFAYDATGNDLSEGPSVEGLPQAVADLDHALRYVKRSEQYQALPIVLLGHSWGGYAAGGVLNYHPDVCAVALFAGFNSSTGLFEQQGRSLMGSGIKLFMPYVAWYERLKFGSYANSTVLDGFAASDAQGLLVHSTDDHTVLSENGYHLFYAAYAESPRFQFVEFNDRGHNELFYSATALAYREQLNADYTEFVEAHGGQYQADIKRAFMQKHLDKPKAYALDQHLMQAMLKFYDQACTESNIITKDY